jgi:hypothetical protein
MNGRSAGEFFFHLSNPKILASEFAPRLALPSCTRVVYWVSRDRVSRDRFVLSPRSVASVLTEKSYRSKSYELLSNP